MGRRRWAALPITAAAVATVAAAVIGLTTLVTGDRGATPLGQAVTAYRDGTAWAPADAAPPAATLDGLRWTEARATTVDGATVVGHRYTGDDGTTVLVVLPSRSFPQPPGARPVPDGDWITEVDGVTVLCTHDPASLVLGTDPATVAATAHALVHPSG